MRLWLLVLALGALGGCGVLPTAAPPPTPTPAAPLTVIADNALSNLMRDLRTGYLQSNPNAAVELVFADPNALREQLEAHPNTSLVVTANQNILDQLETDARLRGPPKRVARDPLVVIVTKENPAGLDRFEDLNKDGLRVALAPENAALGQSSAAFLDNLEHDAAFGPGFRDKFLADAVARPANGAAVVQAVLANQADVGLAFASDADLFAQKLTRLPITEGLGVAAEYSAAVLKTAQPAPDANSFLDFLYSPQAKTLWLDYGFTE